MLVAGVLGAAAGVLASRLAARRARGGGGKDAHAAGIKARMRSLYSEVWNGADTPARDAALKEYVDPLHVLVDPSNPQPTPGRNGYALALSSFAEAFPGATVTIDALLQDGQNAVALLTFSVVQGKRTVAWTATVVCEWIESSEGGLKVSKTWVNSDALSALIQLGLLPDIVVRDLPAPFQRATNKARPGASEAEARASAQRMIEALTGRSAAAGEHPTEVVTG